MAIYRRSSKVKDIFYGNQRVNFVYKGSNLVYKQTMGEIIYENSINGEYIINIKNSGYYVVSMIGGGGGGAGTQSTNDAAASAGSSGSSFKGIVYLNAGDYTIKIGQGGIGDTVRDRDARGESGGNTELYFNNNLLITVPGGGGGHSWWRSGAEYAKTGGLPTLNISSIYSYNNNDGITGEKTTNNGGGIVKGGVNTLDSSYGQGGDAYAHSTISEGYDGYDGWIQISTIRLNSMIFYPSTKIQTWQVPNDFDAIYVDCVASQGWSYSSSITGGKGGRVECNINVSGGQTLYITVGAIPSDAIESSYNASDIRLGGTELSNRIIVAGGGGNAGGSDGRGGVFKGGNGGDLIGENGDANRGYGDTASTGGTQSEGGIKGGGGNYFYNLGEDGSFGLGGKGGDVVHYGGSGGAGGAGWYGGGGGSAPGRAHWDSSAGNGGGGGSSYTNATYCTNVKHAQGYQEGNGYIKIIII